MPRVGIISDTHGLLRPSAVEAFRGCSLIIHAGDVGDPSVLAELGSLAPVHAVRGNVDRGAWAEELPMSDVVTVAGHDLYVLHILDDLALNPSAAGMSAVVFGHSHRADVTYDSGVLYLNPGSAGPRRFDLPATVAVLTVETTQLVADIVELETTS